MVTIENVTHVLRNSPNAYLVVHPDSPNFTVAYANDAFLASTPFNAESIVNKGTDEILKRFSRGLHSRNALAIRNSLETVLLSKEVDKIATLCSERPGKDNGEIAVMFWIAETYPLFDQQGNVKFIVFTPTDVTDGFDAVKDNRLIMTNDFQKILLADYPDAIFTLDLAGNFISFNKELIELLECPKEELLQSSFRSFIREEDLNFVLTYFKKAVTGEVQNFEHPITTAKGNYRFVKLTTIPIRIKKEIIGVSLIVKDITTLKLAELQIEEHNNQISTILESIADAFYALDRNWMVTYWNKEAENILKKTREEMMGKNIWEIFPGAMSLKYYAAYQKAMNENISVRFEESGSTRDISMEVTVYPSSNGLSVYFKDITQRIKDEAQIVKMMERYNNVSKATSDAVYDLDLLKDELLWGEGFMTNFGHQSGSFTLERWKSLLHPEELAGLFKNIEQNKKNKTTRSIYEYRFRCADGTYKYVLDRSLAEYNQEGVCIRVIGALQDITERINHIQAIEVQNKQLNEISWMQSHLVRAPLAQIIGLVELINYDEEDLSKKILLDKLTTSANDLDSVITEIVRKSKIADR